MIANLWHETFSQLEEFTKELEKVKSHVALVEIKPIWRILKSIQLKYVPDLNNEVVDRLNKMVQRLDIREVAPSAFSEPEVRTLLTRFKESCGIDPDMFEAS